MGKALPEIPPTSPGMSREGDMVEKPTNLKFMDHDVRKAQLVSDLDGDPYSSIEHIPKEGTHIVSYVKLHDERTIFSIRFEGSDHFMTVKEQETNQDPIESKVSWKFTSHTMPQLNRKTWPKYIGRKEEAISLKKITDIKDDYRKRRLTTYYAFEK
jgi:hypothetical protein